MSWEGGVNNGGGGGGVCVGGLNVRLKGLIFNIHVDDGFRRIAMMGATNPSVDKRLSVQSRDVTCHTHGMKQPPHTHTHRQCSPTFQTFPESQNLLSNKKGC